MINYNDEYERWLRSDSLTEEEKKELSSISDNEEAKELRFSMPMGFGTAGLRSTMYLGIGCMNRFTVAQTTRAIASLITELGAQKRGVCVVSDSRNNSISFAKVCASVLANAGIKVYTFDGIRPTPELSFALRELNCIAGINITASHNPKEYNGYKAYWEDGAQIGASQANLISERRNNFDVLTDSDLDLYGKYKEEGLICELGCDFDEKYISAVINTAINTDVIREVSDGLRVVYTPLHGAGYKLVPEVFRRVGLKHLYTVDSQMIPDGDFPTVKKPNPEYADVFKLGIEIADKVGSDLVIATDPDSDRVGVMSRGKNGEFATITGNQMGALLLDYVIKQRRACSKLPEYAYAVKSIVSTDMAYAICKKNGVKLHDVLTGFKYIGETVKNYESIGESDGFLLGFEESYGYLLGTYARDKDAVGASMMILEMTAYYKKQNKTLLDALDGLYKEYGYYKERTIDVYMEGYDGLERMKRAMSNLEKNPPKYIADKKVVSIGNYNTGKFENLVTGEITSTNQPKSNVFYYITESDDKIIVRPSGTEPKIKIYVLAHDTDSASLSEKVELYAESSKKLLNS
jgi:phosphoglucomutase